MEEKGETCCVADGLALENDQADVRRVVDTIHYHDAVGEVFLSFVLYQSQKKHPDGQFERPD